MTLSGITLSTSLWLVMATTPPNAEELYTKGEQRFKQQKYAESDRYFRQTIQALELRKKSFKPHSKAWNYLDFGQADALYYRSKIALLTQQKRRSCRLLHQTITKLSGLPKDWPNWHVKEEARIRLQQAQKLFPQQCRKLPSLVTLTLSPSYAQVEYLRHQKWVEIKPDAQGKRTLSLLRAQSLQLRVRAPNYEPQTRTIQIKRWRIYKLTFTLKKKPKPRVAKRRTVRKRPTPPTSPPIYKKPWFWIVIGGGVAAATVGIVAGIALSQPYKEGLRDSPNKEGFSLW